MATVNVSNFAEFVTAVAVSGDTVNLPQDAEWDLNDSCPEGYANNIQINCAVINGNGTKIRNLHMFSKMIVANNLEMNDLGFENVIAEGTAFIDQGSSQRTITMNRCIITGLTGLNTIRFIYGPVTASRCTFNVDMTASISSEIYFIQSLFAATYCRISLKFPQYTGRLRLNASTGGIKYCYVNIFAPATTEILSYNFSGCVVTGNYGDAVDGHTSYRPAFVSVYDVAAFSEDFVPDADYFKPVTYEQLYDASYLASIGFPIGV